MNNMALAKTNPEVQEKEGIWDKLVTAYTFAVTTAMYMLPAWAFNIQHNYNVKDQGSADPVGTVVGVSMYICRIIGVALLIWGIVGFILARKEGDAGSITSEISKLAGGMVLVFMPSVMKALDIIS